MRYTLLAGFTGVYLDSPPLFRNFRTAGRDVGKAALKTIPASSLSSALNSRPYATPDLCRSGTATLSEKDNRLTSGFGDGDAARHVQSGQV